MDYLDICPLDTPTVITYHTEHDTSLVTVVPSPTLQIQRKTFRLDLTFRASKRIDLPRRAHDASAQPEAR